MNDHLHQRQHQSLFTTLTHFDNPDAPPNVHTAWPAPAPLLELGEPG